MADDKNKQPPVAQTVDQAAVNLAILSALGDLTKAVADLKANAAPAAKVDVVPASEAKERREKMRAETKKEGSGKDEVALYLVGGQKAYRGGVTYEPGEVIRLPIAELPSLTFSPVLDEAAKKAADAVLPPKNTTRAADR